MKRKLLTLLISLVIAGLTYAQSQPEQLQAKAERILSKVWKELAIHNQPLRRSSYVTRLDSISTYDASSTLQNTRRYWYDVMNPYLHVATGVYDYAGHYRTDSVNVNYVNNDMFSQSWQRSFDPSSNITSQIYHKHAYDSQNRVSMIVDSSYSSSIWTSTRTFNNNFNSADYPTEVIQQNYDSSVPGYVNDTKIDITYDVSGQKISEALIYSWDGSNWNVAGKLTFTYDSNGNVTQELFQAWAGVTWVPYQRKTITITTNSGNEIHEILKEQYDVGTFSWKNVSRDVYEFDSSGKLIRHETYEWDDVSSSWVGNQKRLITYTTTGNTLSIEGIVYTWNNSTNTWNTDPFNKFVDNYDTNVPFSDVSWPDEINHLDTEERIWLNIYTKYFQLPQYKFIDSYAYEYVSNSWNLLSYRVYYYASSMKVAQIPSDKVKIYPNPAQTHVFVELSGMPEKTTFELYDLTGRKILQTEFTDQTRVDIQQLPAGIYSYKLFNEKGQAQGKLLVE